MPPRVPQLGKAVAQDDQRSLALFNEMEMNPICPDRAMRRSGAELRVAQTGWADNADSCNTKAANEFPSVHWRFSRLRGILPRRLPDSHSIAVEPNGGYMPEAYIAVEDIITDANKIEEYRISWSNDRQT
jgi:hypothetical protein